MREVEPHAELAILLANFNGAGGVLDYVILEPDSTDPPESTHRTAATAGMAAIARRHSSVLSLIWDESKLLGNQISYRTFLGTNSTSPFGRNNPSKGHENTLFVIDGYEGAFWYPPHGLGGSEFEREDTFHSINEEIFGDQPEGAKIYSWSTDWSNYFDAGKEWWGAFYWTIRIPGRTSVVVIGASTTD
jgi:hypothetical protein